MRANGTDQLQPWWQRRRGEPPPITPLDARLITLSPQRWFATANGTTPVFVDITLRNGNGQC